ncbi:MAG TPA: MBOAT family protein [Deltaproteobacteria bacterium]|nr:MBOAT family protein [Deltaproteobacteria bacterium]
MLFNSYIFILAFLPVTLVVFHLLDAGQCRRISVAWLTSASLFFYGWWNPVYLLLILFSMAFNYLVGTRLSQRRSRMLVIFGIAVNLVLLGYFKYANFFVDTFNTLANTGFVLETIVLPLAISFFTFQQITYLIDAYRGLTRQYDFLHYALFVSFFPQLIAGPIVHHSEMMPQFMDTEERRFSHDKFAIGISAFVIGLAKKVLIADEAARYATPVFSAAQAGSPLSFLEAWGGCLAYTFQLYFDFSGYSDMAIGLALMFGITLPLNFFSPYKAQSIIEFWRRWHMTLSRFLRECLYIPLGGNRKGPSRRYINLMITMLLGGLWHGAGWTFVIWGGLHGIYLAINNLWHALKQRLGIDGRRSRLWTKMLSCGITFVAVSVAWVVFRAESSGAALSMLGSMSGMNGLSGGPLFKGIEEIRILVVSALIVWCLPNTYQLLERYRPALETYPDVADSAYTGRIQWSPSKAWAVFVGVMGLAALLSCTRASEFLYFQF